MSTRQMTEAPIAGTPRWRWLFPPRFMLFLAVLPLATLLLHHFVGRWGQSVLGGFDVAALVFLASLWSLGRDHTPEQMRDHAQANDTGRLGMLILTSLVMLVIVTAVAIELPQARHETGLIKAGLLALVLTSLVIAWLFSNLIFALHYAHMYYRGTAEGGLNFPRHGEKDHCPDYWDFAYFALTVGMAFATADIEIARSDIRRIAMVHATAAFFYNLIVLAFTINVTAGG